MGVEANDRISFVAEATAYKHVMVCAAEALTAVLPLLEDRQRSAVLSMLEARLAHLRGEFAAVVLPDIHPVESDAWTQEALEALDRAEAAFRGLVHLPLK